MADSPLGNAPIMAFVLTTNADAARAFYSDVLGLTFIEDDQYALVYNANGIMLRVTRVEEHQPLQSTVLGWRVADIERAVRALIERGVAFERYAFLDQDELAIWRAGAARIAWFKDPDGNVLSLTAFGSP